MDRGQRGATATEHLLVSALLFLCAALLFSFASATAREQTRNPMNLLCILALVTFIAYSGYQLMTLAFRLCYLLILQPVLHYLLSPLYELLFRPLYSVWHTTLFTPLRLLTPLLKIAVQNPLWTIVAIGYIWFKFKQRQQRKRFQEKEEEMRLLDELDAKLTDDTRCSICLGSLYCRKGRWAGKCAILVGCAHRFCPECIIKWQQRSRECPLCRQPNYCTFVAAF